MVWPGLRRATPAGAFLQFQIAVADQVVVADQRLGALGQHHGVVGGELDDDNVVVSLIEMCLTLPTSTPAMRTKSRSLSPLTLVKSAL